jgi:tetratricopeptide (TPR) repeat protein
MFDKAAELDRGDPTPPFYLGRCYLAMADGQFRGNNLPAALRYCDRAVAAFDQAISAFPGFSRAVQGKADALKLKGKHQAALELANWVAAQSGPRAKMLILKGRQYAQAGDMDQAQLAFQQATTVEPQNAAAHAELGLFYMRCENDPAAIESLKKAYDLNPGAPGVVEALAHLGALGEVSSGN